jgi:hypothetical protein
MANPKRSGLFVQLPVSSLKKVQSECKRLDLKQWEFIDSAIRTAPRLTRLPGKDKNIIVSGLKTGG